MVNPYDADSILPAIERAYESGVKVVFVGQSPKTVKYTAYVGTDNKALGRIAASYLCDHIGNKGNVIVIESYRNAPFYEDRHSSFMHEMGHNPDVKIVASFDAAWDAEKAHEGLDSLSVILKGTPVDAVFAFGDDMIIGAAESGVFPGALYVGLDGILGKGIDAIHQGKIDATFTNPTNGDVAIRTAVSIINGEYVKLDNVITPQLIDHSNVDAFSEAASNLDVARRKIDVLNNDLEWVEYRYYSRRPWFIAVIVLAAFLLLCTLVGVWHSVTLGKRSKSYAQQLDAARKGVCFCCPWQRIGTRP